MNANSIIPNSFTEARELLGDRDARTVDRNTLLVPLPDGSIGLKYHRTVIVRWFVSGAVDLFTAGYRTSTTKERMNQALPAGYRVFQRANVWRIEGPDGLAQDFNEGIMIQPEAIVDALQGYREQA